MIGLLAMLSISCTYVVAKDNTVNIDRISIDGKADLNCDSEHLR